MTRFAFVPAALLAAASGLGAAPAMAQSASKTFQPPAGCEAFVTVQYAQCGVSHHFTCTADPEGWQRRVDMDEDGINYFGAIDAETQWVESLHLRGGFSETLGEATDPASFSGLTSAGVDTFDFTTQSDEVGPTRYVGQDRLTGETVEIDGVTLDRTEFAITAYAADGSEMWRSSGSEYISRDWAMFLSGQSTTTAAGESWDSNDRPVQFIFPGEAGFLTASPTHGCGVVLSSAPRDPAFEEYSYAPRL